MSDANSLRSLRCPNCGAPLDLVPGQTTIRCRFCDSVFEHSTDALTADDHSRIASADPASSPGIGASAGAAKRYIIKMRDGQPVVIEAGGAGGMGQPPSAWDAAAPAWQSSSPPSYVASPPVIMSPPVQRGSRLGCILGWTIGLVVLCSVVSALVLSFSPAAAVMVGQLLSGNVQQALGPVGALGVRILVDRSGTIVPGPNDAPAQAIMITRQYPTSGSDAEVRLVAVDTTTRKLLWQTAPLDKQLYDTPILVNQDFVFIVNNQILMAIKRMDGTVGWQATLADKISFNLCKNCAQLVGTRLATLSDDGTLEVFDAATGRSLWQVKSNESSPRGLYLLGQRLAFMDRNANNQGVLRAFDPDTGTETTAQPGCKGSEPSPDYADWTTPLFVSPNGQDFYLVFGSFAQCAQRWDAKSLKMVWSTPLPQGFSPSLDGLLPTFSSDTLYLANDSAVLALAQDGGAAHIAVTNPDYRFQVMSTHGDDVIVQATNQHGTTQYQIWAVNGASGQAHWKFDLREDHPFEPGGIIDENVPQWLAQPAADGLRVVRFKSASDKSNYAILTDVLNWDTGQSAGQKSTPLSIDTIILQAPDWMIWKNDTLWMATNNLLMAFDAAQNKIVYTWP